MSNDPFAHERAYWLGFSRIPELGARRFAVLHTTFGSARSAWQASEADLRASGLTGLALANLVTVRLRIDLEAEMQRVTRCGARIITLEDAEYPAALRSLDDAPIILYVRGQLLPTDDRSIAVVGTRRATQYGLDVTTLLCRELAQQGFTIVSGLAHGIDAAAHRAALEVGGRTLAVLGCGIDDVYPRDHRSLADEISEHGALVSEFPVGARPERHHFPRRNRVISGLSLGVLIPEAPDSSGALITATYAGEQGRDVFAVPGNIFHASSSGTNRLIQDGAKLVLSIEDILDELDVSYTTAQVRSQAAAIAPGDPLEEQLLALLTDEPIHIDELVRRSGLPTAQVSSTFVVLELKGLARSAGHMQYCLPLKHS